MDLGVFVGRTLIRQGSVSLGLVLIGCGKLVVFIFLYYFVYLTTKRERSQYQL